MSDNLKKGLVHTNNGIRRYQLLFVGLKLAEIGIVAEWSWWWVMAPTFATWSIAIAYGVFEAVAEARDPTRRIRRNLEEMGRRVS